MWLSSKKEGLSGSSYQVGLSRATKTLGNKSFIGLFDIFMCEVMWSISECDNPGNPVTLPYIHNTYTNCHLYNNTRKQELFSFYFKHLNNSIKWSAWQEVVLLLLALTRDTWRQLEEGPSTCPAQECLQRQGHMWILSSGHQGAQ